MNLLEYQAKTLMHEFGLPIPNGVVVQKTDEAAAAFNRLDAPFCMVKAQIRAGQRAAGGGIHRADNATACEVLTSSLLGSRLVTPQTSPQGLIVDNVLIESGCQAARELYLALLLDPASGELVALAAPVGGSVVGDTELPERLSAPSHDVAHLSLPLTPGIDASTLTELADVLLLDKEQRPAFGALMDGLHRAFIERDAMLLEVNPLAVTEDGQLCCLDVKLSIDDNASYRQPWLKDLDSSSTSAAGESDATDSAPSSRARRVDDGFNLEPLGGNVGCIVTGAGLALATMDLLDDYGMAAANFLDLPPGARVADISRAVSQICADPGVDRILIHGVNGGFTRCDSVAEGVADSARHSRIADLPIVVRFAGAGHANACQLLTNAGLKFTRIDELADIGPALIACKPEDARP